MNRLRHTLPILLICFATSAAAEDPELAKLFAERGAEGTLVITSLNTQRRFTHSDARAMEPVSPASTFKIFNTLIALQENAVSPSGTAFTWDGHVHEFAAWNRDQTLESAFQRSCVWCYQALARRVGADTYHDYLNKAQYGELHAPFGLTTFWLDGSLKISAAGQIEFLRKVYTRTLPFRDSAYETLRQIMLVEQTPTYALWAKTGWAAWVEPQIGWYVGYIETGDDVWFFALNIDVRNKSDLPLRQALVRAALTAKGILGH